MGYAGAATPRERAREGAGPATVWDRKRDPISSSESGDRSCVVRFGSGEKSM
jgi:hypothetical protein